jgi:hypothetical protein
MKTRWRFLKWAAHAVGGAFILYMLSLGPVFVTRSYNKLPQLQPWWEFYLQPANCLAAFRPLGALMEWYVGVWLRLTDAPEGTE